MIYVSDLDGTLLNTKGQLSEFTINTIKQMEGEGIKFTIASARSIFTARDFLNQLNLKIPVVLRNGAFVYNPIDNSVLMQKLLTQEEIQPILEFFIKEGLNPIVHHTSDNTLYVDYTKIDNYGEMHYIESRLNAGDSRFRNVKKYRYSPKSEFISMCVIDENHRQDDVYDRAMEMFPEGYIIHKYVDTYSNHTWIEINHPNATKRNAIRYVMDYLGETEYTAFGDNINDLGMLEGADKAYIPLESYLANAGYDYEKTLSIDSDGVALKLIQIVK